MPARVPEADGSELLFYGYLLLIVIEHLGLSAEVSILKTVRFTTFLSYGLAVAVVAKIGVGNLFRQRQTGMFLTFIALTIASVAWAYIQLHAVQQIRPLVDYFVFFILTFTLVDRRSRIERLAWTILVVYSILVLRNFEKLGSSERVGGFRAAYFLGDGNDLAWGMNVMLPLILSLVFAKRKLLFRMMPLGGVALCVLTIVGTQSRGGTLGLGAAVLFYWAFVARRKALGLGAVVVLVLGIVLVAPSTYLSRMNTVQNFEEDNSARSRLQTWGAAIRMAADHPLGVGAGNFPSVYGRFYKPTAEKNQISWAQNRWLNAHSIYFKVLGEYGFPGLALLLWLIVATVRDSVANARLLYKARDRVDIPAYWPALLSMSIVGYAVSGAFLGGFEYPHLFFLAGLVLATKEAALRGLEHAPVVCARPGLAVVPEGVPNLPRVSRGALAAARTRPPTWPSVPQRR